MRSSPEPAEAPTAPEAWRARLGTREQSPTPQLK